MIGKNPMKLDLLLEGQEVDIVEQTARDLGYTDPATRYGLAVEYLLAAGFACTKEARLHSARSLERRAAYQVRERL